MKKLWRTAGCAIAIWALTLVFFLPVHAAGADTIHAGIYAGDMDLSGKTAAEAKMMVEAYLENLKSVQITLKAAGGKEVVVTAEDFGISWANPELIEEAMRLGRKGNIIERYKALQDLEHDKYCFDIKLDFDVLTIDSVLAQQCVKYNQKAVNMSLKRVNGKFETVEGQIGYFLDVETSIDKIYDYLTQKWNGRPCSIELNILVQEPLGSEEELAAVTDVLGSYTTNYSTSGSSRSANVENGCRLVNQTTLYPGEEFSFCDRVTPFTAANGYYMAGSYINGKVVDSLGGGICQVSSTLYNAMLLAELEVTERHNHSMIVSYVEPSADAAVSESSGKDFRFVNNTDAPIYIEGYCKNRNVTFNIYGKENRSAGRSVHYESEVLEVIDPSVDQIYADASKPLGYFAEDSAHIGYKARLWKVVTENGTSKRTQMNSSSYKMTPRSATVGTSTGDTNAYNEVMAAISTGNIDHTRNVIAYLTTPQHIEVDEE